MKLLYTKVKVNMASTFMVSDAPMNLLPFLGN